MTLFRRFVVILALLLWQGGFLFYAAVVVPIGTDELGSLSQGRVTQRVTTVMNMIGIAAIAMFTWEGWGERGESRLHRLRWTLSKGLLFGLVALLLLHGRIETYLDNSNGVRITDYPAFYAWHRAYLLVSTVEWLVAMTYLIVTLKLWSAPREG
jgi:hypothetical protein